jgi:two-component system nitrate/nitrite response regulator NarL
MSSATAAAILVVDDHALFRESIARLLDPEPGFRVAAHCGSISEALEVLRRTHVDLILLDFDLGDRDGLHFMEAARGLSPARVLVVTAGVEPEDAVRLMRAGVSGIFLKRDSAASLATAIRDVLSGRVAFGHEALQRALAEVEAQATRPKGPFTARERQVLTLVLEGLANKEIGARLGVSESAVKATLQQLFAKTGVRTRSQLVRIALERHRHEL